MFLHTGAAITVCFKTFQSAPLVVRVSAKFAHEDVTC
jgi:hypothetical protein